MTQRDITQRLTLTLIALALSTSALGCQTTGVLATDTGSPPPVDAPGADTGPGSRTMYSYMPMGCTYMVSSPRSLDTGPSRDVFGAAPMSGPRYTSLPTHVHTSWAGPTDTTFAVNWHTDNATYASSMLIGTDRAMVMAADGAGAGVTRQDGHYVIFTALMVSQAEMVHEVHVCGLTAGTNYYYRVGGPGHWSSVFAFATGPAVGATSPFTIGVTGDSRGYDMNAWAITEQRMQARAVDFELFSGDAVQFGQAQGEWNQFFEQQIAGSFTVQDFMATRAMMIANGNHDQLTVNYLAQFALPQHPSPGQVGQGEDWYSFDYGNAHFAVLNDTVTDNSVIAGSEADWLRTDLMAVNRTRTPWIFVMHHQPLYTCSTGGHNPDTALRSAWQPIFDQFHVDFVIAGHNHEYERSRPIYGYDAGGGHVAPAVAGGAPVIAADGSPSGTIYLVAAGAGAPLYTVDTTCAETASAVSIRAYVTIRIAGRSLTLNAYDALTDSMIDSLTYTK